MRFENSIVLAIIFTILSCQTRPDKANVNKINFSSENISIQQLSANTFMHTSFLETNGFGKVLCNGMIVINNNEAVVFDTPVHTVDADELMDWIVDSLHCNIKAVVATHFHNDCLASLASFHSHGIPSYASSKTIEFAKKDSVVAPQHAFDDFFEIAVGNTKVINRFVGEGHTKDNIVSYFPDEKVLFGGCLIKALDAPKGYLGDANVAEWSHTVSKLSTEFDEAEIIIPGHGKAGDRSLLDYTIQLFQ